MTLFLWWIQGWRPSLDVSWKSLGKMYNFGYKLFLSGLLDTVFNNVYLVVIAKLFTTSIAGLYFFADKLKTLVINQLVGSIQNVTYPALSSIQGDDTRLKNGFRKIIQVTTFILFPAMLILAAIAEPLFVALLPAKWLPAVPYLQLLCISGVMYPLHSINLNILKVKGRSDLFLYLEIIKKIMMVVILAISFRYGVFGILIGQIIGSVLAYIPNSYFSAKLINYSVREQVSDFMPSLVLTGAVASLIYGAAFLIQWTAFLKLMVLVFMTGLLYLSGAHFFKLQAYLLARMMLIGKMMR